MTINSLSPVQSTPFCGLETQTYNCTATGLYTVNVTCTIPWMTSDQPSYVVATRNVQTVTTRADSSGDLNDTYFTFYDAGDVNGFYVWYNINSSGTDPAVDGLTGIEVTGATNASANTLATATRAAINAACDTVTASGATSAVILTNDGAGACTEAADADSPDDTGFTFAVGTTGTYGSSSGLVIRVYNDDDLVMTLSQPTPTQATLSGAVTTQVTSGDAITVTFASQAQADTGLNAVKGVINVFLGE